MLYARIKDAVTMQEIATRYGFTPDRKGYISCPFHGEKTASLKIYPGNRGWYCFGCGKGGTVIDFTARYFNLDAHQAAVRLNYDFNLGLITDKLTPHEIARINAERKATDDLRHAAEDALRDYQQEYDENCRLFYTLNTALPLVAPASPEDKPSLAFQLILNSLTDLQHYFATHEWKDR
ncbi:MAG: CHC2 zinc finger domain-containing protein [Eubacteriales bacterium]